MLIPVLLFIVGLLCLIKGGDWLRDFRNLRKSSSQVMR